MFANENSVAKKIAILIENEMYKINRFLWALFEKAQNLNIAIKNIKIWVVFRVVQ